MSKFYVESGPRLLVVLEANDVFEAIVNALETQDDAEPLELADVIIVNERGFVWQRPEHELFGDETVLPTRLVLGDSWNECHASHSERPK